jgi:protein phosphatase
MGTTAVAGIVNEDLLTVGSAGDSRCYVLSGGKLVQVTRDDSWVSAAWAEGILNAQEIERHPLRNVITKAVGAKEDIEIDVVERKLLTGDLVLICSDGLHSMISDEKIQEALAPVPASLEEGVAKLIAAANEAGGKDNVSVVLVRYTE